MGSSVSKQSKPISRAAPEVVQSALSKRAPVHRGPPHMGPSKGIGAVQPKDKPIFANYNENAMNEMSKVLKITTKPYPNKANLDPENNAALIRFHKDNKIEDDRKKGIVRGRAQLREAELMALLDQCRDGEEWEPTKIAKELNVTTDEVLALVKSARLPWFKRERGDIV
eukprot:CAMPEP_0185028818 /NCGR_PEP_ID=MMETSP1103-20130426/14839_1 /TAXON_ID=36769 /ORGANISM="Paraphysomonas bandaiensis, Strain Caron Lab Isolate" /LENGTH=168 /DNA_ID=CAMNT_0027563355 /DNA_START=22 /DNA_END=524 /DNA_ORIENTATION=-